MIAQLVRTKFESNLLSFIVFIALLAVAGARYLMTREAPQGPVTRETFVAAASTVMLCCFVPGIISLLRQNRERSSRLYAQLPVSPRQIRVAYWLHVSLYLVIAGALLQAFLLFAGTEPAADVDYRVVSLLVFVNLYLWLAGFSLATSNLSRMISDKIRRNTVLYCFLVIVATFVIVYALILATLVLSGQLQNALQDGTQMLPVLVTLSTLCIAMVALDIYLFGKKDHNLG